MRSHPHSRSRARELLAVVLLVLVIALTACSQGASANDSGALSGTFAVREGDVVFQSCAHNHLTDMIEGATGSPYSHCGIVERTNGRWLVIEAIGPVKETSLENWIKQGRGSRIDVYRLAASYDEKIPAFLAAARTYLGRPYDLRYRMDDDAIYCSELVYKSFDSAAGEKLGSLVRLRDLDWQPFEATIRQLENGPPPLDREMITPRDLAKAAQLTLVYKSEK